MPERTDHTSLVTLVVERFDRTDAKLDGIGSTLAEHSAALRLLDNRVGGIEVRVEHVEEQADEATRALTIKDARAAVEHEHEQVHTRLAEKRVERRSYWMRWAVGSVAAAVVAVLSGLATLYLRGLIR